MNTFKTLIFLGSLLLLNVSIRAQRTVTTINNSKVPIWVGAEGKLVNGGQITPFNPNRGGWYLAPNGGSVTVTVPNGWEGRFWGRTGCNFDEQGNGSCLTGNCGGGLHCDGLWGKASTLAELKFNGWMDLDFYDVSLIDGFNIPLLIVPVPGTFTPNGDYYYGGTAGCTTDLNPLAPPELQIKDSNGKTVAWMATCVYQDIDKYCCYDNDPATCHPNKYSRILKAACPDAYSYVTDHETSTFACKGADYQIVFPEPTPPGGTNAPIKTWISSNIANNFIIHKNGRGRISNSTTSEDDGKWKMVPGLAGRGVSFQSVNFPNRYLRHRNSEVWLDAEQSNVLFKEDATFLIRRGLSDQTLTSFESLNFPGRYLRHKNFLLYVEAINSELDKKDATFSDTNGNGGGGATKIKYQAENFNVMNGVTIENVNNAEENKCVGWIDSGDWMVYANIQIPETGQYTMQYSVSSPNGGQLTQDLNAGTTLLGTIQIPKTNGWHNWTTVSQTVYIEKGTHDFGIFAASGGWNIDWWSIESADTKIKSSPVFEAGMRNRNDHSIFLYPNPVKDVVRISGLQKGDTYTLISFTGEKIFDGIAKTEVENIPIPVDHLAPGMYFIKTSKNRAMSFVKK